MATVAARARHSPHQKRRIPWADAALKLLQWEQTTVRQLETAFTFQVMVEIVILAVRANSTLLDQMQKHPEKPLPGSDWFPKSRQFIYLPSLIAEIEQAADARASVSSDLQAPDAGVAIAASSLATPVRNPADPLERLVSQARDAARYIGDKGTCIFDAAVQNFKTPKRYEGNVKSLSLAMTCFRRGWQLKWALPLNLLTLLPYAAHACICVVVFGSHKVDFDTLSWIRSALNIPPLETCLRVAHASSMSSWHASVAKNTAHRLAIDSVVGSKDENLIVNLDADNIMTAEFLSSAFDRVMQSLFFQRDLYRWHGDDAGCTGRIGLSAALFRQLNGFDEEFLPSGFQDIDWIERTKGIGGKVCDFRRIDAGFSIPNDFDDVRFAQNGAKIVHCADSTGLSWSQMNQRNSEQGKRKSRSGEHRRNPEKRFNQLGLQYTVLDRISR